VREISVAIVYIECVVVVGKSCDIKIHLAVAVEITDRNSHRSLLAAVFAQRKTGQITYILKCPVMTIFVEIVRHRIVGDKKIDPAVVINVNENRSETVVSMRIGNTRFLADIREGSVAVVVKQMIAFSLKSSRAAHYFYAAELTIASRTRARFRWMVWIVFGVSGNKQIKQAVVVVVAPCRPTGPATKYDTRFFCNVRKCAVVIVVIQAIFSKIRYIDVGPAVVIVISDGHSKTPAFIRDARFVRNIRKRAVVIVVKKHCARRGLFAFK